MRAWPIFRDLAVFYSFSLSPWSSLSFLPFIFHFFSFSTMSSQSIMIYKEWESMSHDLAGMIRKCLQSRKIIHSFSSHILHHPTFPFHRSSATQWWMCVWANAFDGTMVEVMDSQKRLFHSQYMNNNGDLNMISSDEIISCCTYAYKLLFLHRPVLQGQPDIHIYLNTYKWLQTCIKSFIHP